MLPDKSAVLLIEQSARSVWQFGPTNQRSRNRSENDNELLEDGIWLSADEVLTMRNNQGGHDESSTGERAFSLAVGRLRPSRRLAQIKATSRRQQR